MSWASVAQRRAKSIQQIETKIKVQYNVLPKIAVKEKIDNIPRHRENTPDPADDFLMTNNCITTDKYGNIDYWPKWKSHHGWIDYTKDEYLTKFKETLPLSIQQIN